MNNSEELYTFVKDLPEDIREITPDNDGVYHIWSGWFFKPDPQWNMENEWTNYVIYDESITTDKLTAETLYEAMRKIRKNNIYHIWDINE